MFTGIIEEVGRIRAIERQAVSARLTELRLRCSRMFIWATALRSTVCV